MLEKIKVFALGGLDENGKSLYVVNYNEKLFVFDAGLRYPEESLLGIDVILPGYQYLLDNKNKIVGFFLTHGHDENMGALPFIIEGIQDECHVYGTKFTLLSLMHTAKRFKKKINNVKFHPVGSDVDFDVNGFSMHTFAVTHGVPDACGYALETNSGLIVYSGDFILDFSAKFPYNTNVGRMYDLAKKGTFLLLSESYNSTYNGFIAPNNRMLNKLIQIMDDVRGRIFISIYGQTVFQVQEILDAAISSRRKVFLYTEQAKETIKLIKHEFPEINIPDALFTTNIYERDCVILVSELGNKVFEILSNIADQNNQENKLKFSKEDAFVIASGAHTGTELSFARILDKLYMTGAQVLNISKEIASMHGGSEDLKALLNIFRPKYYMPVRGYYVKLVENAKLALSLGYTHSNILVYDNGMVATFENGELVRNIENIEANEIMVDGIGIGDVGNVVINDRRKLSRDGVLVIGVSFSMSTRKIVAGPDVQIRGFGFVKDEEKAIEKIAKCFSSTVYNFVQKPGLVDFNELRMLCKENVSTLIKNEYDKEPMILPVIISV